MTDSHVLHILAQRPGRTRSGITLEALVRHCVQAGYEQAVVIGVPATDRDITVGDLPASRIFPLTFADNADPKIPAALDFPVPGMSDVMPYESTVYSRMTAAQLEQYESAWRAHLASVRNTLDADILHVHHAWIVASIARQIWPDTPLVLHTHGTALRQAALCPQIATRVRPHIERVDHCVVLHAEHQLAYASTFGIPLDRITVVGAGYREDLFHETHDETTRDTKRILYAGKLSSAKGLPWLLDAFERIRDTEPGATLALAGSGTGDEAAAITARAHGLDGVTLLGALDQAALADEMRASGTFILPSFYEGLPLVLVEAAACGCRLVSTALPGVQQALADPFEDRLLLVALPPMASIDAIDSSHEAQFIEHLADAMRRSIAQHAPPSATLRSRPFTWNAVTQRIEAIWRTLTHISEP